MAILYYAICGAFMAFLIIYCLGVRQIHKTEISTTGKVSIHWV